MSALDDIKARVEGHTQGPWTPQEYDDNPGDQGVPIIGGGEPGSMEGHLVAYALTLSNEQQCVADGALIAAAPKLLTALEAVEEALKVRANEYRDTAEHLNQLVIDRSPDRNHEAAARYAHYAISYEAAHYVATKAIEEALR